MSEKSRKPYLLEGLLSPKDCAQCKFCCSCRRSSLWENVIFDDELYSRVKEEYPEAKFMEIPLGSRVSHMLDFSGLYKTDDPDEEALCFFNRDGCLLGADKPFECAIWPLRVMDRDGTLTLGYCLDCPIFAAIDPDRIMQFIREEKLDEMIFDYTAKHPETIKSFRGHYQVLMTADDLRAKD